MNGFFATWMLTAALSGAASDGQWHNDYAQALADAKADGKPLLVVLHKPDQPEQCVQQVVHTEPAEKDSLASNYHLCQIDVTTPMGQQVAQAFKAASFPHTVITDKKAQKIIFRKTGNFSDGEWNTTLADYRRGVRPVTYSSAIISATSGYCPNCQQ